MQSMPLYGGMVYHKHLAQLLKQSFTSSVHRTVSESIVMVTLGLIPVALIARERETIYREKREDSVKVKLCVKNVGIH